MKGVKSECPKKDFKRQYQIWINIKARCFNKNRPDYKHYGGRGITISDEFRNNFLAFLSYIETIEFYKEWLINPSSTLSLDRINNDKNYERGNLRFTDKSTQTTNRRFVPNKTGYKWVYLKSGKFVASVKLGDKYHHLGYFSAAEEANSKVQSFIAGYNAAKQEGGGK